VLPDIHPTAEEEMYQAVGGDIHRAAEGDIRRAVEGDIHRAAEGDIRRVAVVYMPALHLLAGSRPAADIQLVPGILILPDNLPDRDSCCRL
jgi:hypothetical protein